MFGVLLALSLPFAIAGLLRTLAPNIRDARLQALLLAGYVCRLIASTFVNKVNIYSYGSGGDAQLYEVQADAIAKLWHFTGVHYVGVEEFPDLGSATLPQNIFALIDYANGEATRLGCTAFIAALACMTCINMYAIAIDIGARQGVAIAVVAVILFMPGYVLYTSDAYKDGIVIFFEFAILRSVLRLSRSFSLLHLLVALLGLLALWATRYYLVYALGIPLGLSLAGLRDRSLPRLAITAGLLALLAFALLAYTRGLEALSENASATFQQGTSEAVQLDNASGGSGVAFDTSSPYASFGPKLLYTLFSPFPWQSGSIALQVGKLETAAWYYFFYRTVRFAPYLWRTRRSEVLLFVSFIVPVFLMYTLSFSNVGLVLRERLGAVFAISLLAAATWRSSPLASQAGQADAGVFVNDDETREFSP